MTDPRTLRVAIATCALALAAAGARDRAAASPGGGMSRVKEIARIEGSAPVPVVGYGLVVGLEGTGDGRGTLFTVQSVANLLQNLGLTVDSKAVRVKNVAAVTVTAEITPFARAGTTFDATVSSLGDATSLQGGTLLQTVLVDPNGDPVGHAQGAISIGGYSAQTASGTAARKNHATVGRVPGGGAVERLPSSQFGADTTLALLLREPDATTALRVARAISARYGEGAAEALDPLAIRVHVPEAYRSAGSAIAFLSEIENLEVPVDIAARVVLNERTGTVVVGSGVRILPVAVSHGSLSIKVRSTPLVSQPAPFGPESSSTVVTRQDEVSASEEGGDLVLLESGASVGELAQALNAIGVTPRDMIAILQAIRSAGALQAEIVIQ